MAYIDFAELKECVSIRDGMKLLGLDFKRSGQSYRGPCPACESGGDRALVVTPSKNAFYCFAQRRGGDVIALVAHVKGISMKEAAETLAGDSFSSTRNSNSTRKSTVPEERTEQKEAEPKQLQPLRYLQSDHDLVLAAGVLPDTADYFGAGYAPKGIMRTKLAIPVHTWEGALVAYAGRDLKGDGPKLVFPNGFRPEQHLFNAHRIKSSGELYCTRDPLDVLTAFENGIENIVSILTDEYQSEQLVLIASLMDSRDIEHVEFV